MSWRHTSRLPASEEHESRLTEVRPRGSSTALYACPTDPNNLESVKRLRMSHDHMLKAEFSASSGPAGTSGLALGCGVCLLCGKRPHKPSHKCRGSQGGTWEGSRLVGGPAGVCDQPNRSRVRPSRPPARAGGDASGSAPACTPRGISSGLTGHLHAGKSSPASHTTIQALAPVPPKGYPAKLTGWQELQPPAHGGQATQWLSNYCQSSIPSIKGPAAPTDSEQRRAPRG